MAIGRNPHPPQYYWYQYIMKRMMPFPLIASNKTPSLNHALLFHPQCPIIRKLLVQCVTKDIVTH
jgi:hypothetical protein